MKSGKAETPPASKAARPAKQKKSQARSLQHQYDLTACPWCERKDGLWADENTSSHPALKFSVACVCGASGALRATVEEAVEWWNMRKATSVPAGGK